MKYLKDRQIIIYCNINQKYSDWYDERTALVARLLASGWTITDGGQL